MHVSVFGVFMESTGHILATLGYEKKTDSGLIVSDEANKPDSASLLPLIHCIASAHEKIELCSSLPGLERNAEQVDNARKRMNEYIKGKIETVTHIKERLLLIIFNKAIENQQAGNCYEFSFYTKFLLDKAGVSTEVWRAKKPNTKDSHVFLVVKEDDGSSGLGNPDGIIVDPFMKKIFCTKELSSYLKVCVFDEETQEVFYVPYDEAVHDLDNKAQAELLEDWQKFIDVRDHRVTRGASSLNPETPESKFKP